MIELEFICDTCGTPIADGYGSIRMPYEALNEARFKAAESQEGVGGVGGVVTVGAVLSLPPILHWQILHFVCSPDDDAYEIDVDLVRTLGDLDRWNDHLRAKNWLPLTDWDELVAGVSAGRDDRVAAKQPHGEAP